MVFSVKIFKTKFGTIYSPETDNTTYRQWQLPFASDCQHKNLAQKCKKQSKYATDKT